MALDRSTFAQAQEIYGKAGFMGAGIDYAHGARTPLTPRGDVTTVGAITRDGSRSECKHSTKIWNDQATSRTCTSV